MWKIQEDATAFATNTAASENKLYTLYTFKRTLYWKLSLKIRLFKWDLTFRNDRMLLQRLIFHIIHRHNFCLKRRSGECLHPQIKCLLSWAQSMQTESNIQKVYLNKNRTVDNAKKASYFINIPRNELLYLIYKIL
jgi:hypothetical protein